MSHTVTYLYDIMQVVKLPAIQQKATVIQCMTNKMCVNEYRLVYWADSRRFDEWFYEWEIEA